MGVDISLHIEIRKQNEWHLMTFDITLLKQDYHHEYLIFDTEVYNRRYHHFDEFLDEAPSHTRCKKDILSAELQMKLENDDCFGTFMFDDLEKHCNKLEKLFISGITHAGIFTIKQQLDRIEQKLNDGANYSPPAEERERTYEEIVHFRADELDFSAQYGKWHPATDSYLRVDGIRIEKHRRKNGDITEIYNTYVIGESM